jgi:hypothetical protein
MTKSNERKSKPLLNFEILDEALKKLKVKPVAPKFSIKPLSKV